jgi:short-subunit dehydrogenase
MKARTIAITGASRGLGAAIARGYAQPGTQLYLAGRSTDALEAVAASCRQTGAEADTATFDVAEPKAARDWVARCTSANPLDLLFVNAGLFDGRRERDLLEAPEVVQALLRTNLEGAIHVAAAGAATMRAAGHGRIVLVTSLAALHPLADAAAYSASKAGLQAYGEALREQLAPHGVGVSLVLPGHVETAQTARQKGALPMLTGPEAAARRIRRALDREREIIAFPAPLYWLVRLGRLAPWRVRAFLGRSQRFHVE